MPVQNCSLLKAIKVNSDHMENGSFFMGSRFAPSICRSVIEENGRDVIWGKAEEEIELILQLHLRRIFGQHVPIKNVRLIWEGDDSYTEDDEEKSIIRRSDYRAIFIQGKEIESFKDTQRATADYYAPYCSLDTEDVDGTYLVCRKINTTDWDRLMVEICVRSIRLKAESS